MHNIKSSILLASVVALAGCGAESYSEADAEIEQTEARQEALAAAPRYVVDLATDSTTGVCRKNGSSRGRCNLRAAVLTAQSAGGNAVIELAVNSVVSAGEIAVSGGLVTIRPKTGQGLRSIKGSANSRLFRVAEKTTLNLSRLSISNFSAFDLGGAIWNNGTLELDRAVLSSNKASCFGNGAMTAFATCAGGAIWNQGKLVVRNNSRFENNTVSATAQTASFTNASSGGGAISSVGTIEIEPPIAFVGNSATASALSGFHGNMPSGAWANSGGGAISSSGDLLIGGGAAAVCTFTNNSAQATAEAISPAVGNADSAGGAISVSGAHTIAPGCVFTGNASEVDPDIHIVPTSP